MTEYRAEFDAQVTLLNGGGLQAQGFRLDIPGPGVSEPEPAATGRRGRMVELSHVVTAGMVTYPGLPGPEITGT
jgi:hypothetical protein